MPPSGTLTGTLTYNETAPLSASARALVVLVEGAGKPTAGSIVAQTLLTDFGQKPIAFELPYGNGLIDPNVTYTIAAAIQDGTRTWTTGQGTPVITKGNELAGITVPVSPVSETTESDVRSRPV